MRNEFAIISNYILHNKLDIICLTETWINHDEFSNSFTSSLLPQNYSLSQYYRRRRPTLGGGLAIISHKSIHHATISTPVYTTFECIGSSVSLSNFSFKIFTTYRHHQVLLSALILSLENHITSNVNLIFVGDFNIHINKQVDPNNVLFNKSLIILILISIFPLPFMISVTFST